MAHLNLRTRPEDERNISLLKQAWGLDRSEIARKALAEAARMAQKEKALTKKEILEKSKFVGSVEGTEPLRSRYKQKMKDSLQRKYVRKFKK